MVSDADAVLTLLADNGGIFPKLHGGQAGWAEGLPAEGPAMRKDLFDQPILSPVTPYESRFFSVLLSGDGVVLQTNTDQIAAVDAEGAAVYAQSVVDTGETPVSGEITATCCVRSCWVHA